MSNPRNTRAETSIERESQIFGAQSQQGEKDSHRWQHHTLQGPVGHSQNLDIILNEPEFGYYW